MSEPLPSAEEFSRPAKALVDGEAVGTFADAQELLARARPNILVGDDAVTLAHQAALLTAVETTNRTFGGVDVQLPPRVAETPIRLSGHSGSIGDAVLEAGATLGSNDEFGSAQVNSARPNIVIGTATGTGDLNLQVTWDHWFAHINIHGRHLLERGTMVLAAVAAAAMAVTECFKRTQGSLEACHRNRSLNLWRPDRLPTHDPDVEGGGLPGADSVGPDLRYLPSAVWFVGLGHLGQGYAWCWSLLPYREPSDCVIYLQDFDKIIDANHTTGLFVRKGDTGVMKTRVVSRALERAGFDTRIIERRITGETRWHNTEPELALIGVDKVEPRRLISDVGWKFAIDVGLGAGPIDFTGISMHTFPAATHSAHIPAWQPDASRRRAESNQERRAYQAALAAGADPCGVIQLAETAVAAPFVGVVAACLAVAEPLRLLHGGPVSTNLTFDSGRLAQPRSTPSAVAPRIGSVLATAAAD